MDTLNTSNHIPNLELSKLLSQSYIGQRLLEKGRMEPWLEYLIACSPSHEKWSDFEQNLIDTLPIFQGIKSNFKNTQTLLQGLIQSGSIKSGASLGSVPCGMMEVLLSLNFSGLSNIKLIGVNDNTRLFPEISTPNYRETHARP
jgi:hypothetical protein